MRPTRLAVMVLSASLAVGCGTDQGAPSSPSSAPTTRPSVDQQALEANRELWRSLGVTRYHFTARLGWDWGSRGTYQIWVDGSRVVEVPPAGEDPDPWLNFGDMEWLFDVVQGIPPQWLGEVTYDPAAGFPSMVLGVGPGHEEWMLWVGGFTPTDEEPPPVPEAGIDLPWMSNRQVQMVAAVVAGTVGETTGVSLEDPGWVVTFEVDAVHFARGSSLAATGTIHVVDQLRPARPPLLRGRGGERFILFLDEGHDGTLRLRWVARPGSEGLDFVGPVDAAPYLDAEVPRLCVPPTERSHAASARRHAGAELALLVRWMAALEHSRSAGDAALTPERAEELLARACRED